MKARAAAAAVAVACAAAGCARVAPFTCEHDDQCAPGRCESSGACSFADQACRTGWRYGADGPGEVADLCVGDESGAIAQIAAGSEHACARGDDGRLWCWGSDKDGGLGRPGDDAPGPARVAGLGDVTDVDGGEFHTCAIAGGRVWCWGAGADGELGRGTESDDPTPEPVVALDGATDVDLGEWHSCALLGDGGVWCWGRDADGEIAGDGDGAMPEPTRIDVPAAHAIAAGGQEGCALVDGGDVWCWGKNVNGQLGVPGNGRTKPTRVPGFAGAVQVVVGGEHTCALFGDGHAACVGLDDHGQLGDDGAVDKSTHDPVDVAGLDDAVELAALDWSTCARRADGSVVCWGEGDHGELGAGTDDRAAPGPAVPLPAPAVALAGGESFACARTDDGCLWCWGLDGSGQLGDGPGDPGGVRPVLLGACTESPAR